LADPSRDQLLTIQEKDVTTAGNNLEVARKSGKGVCRNLKVLACRTLQVSIQPAILLERTIFLLLACCLPPKKGAAG
jgi:hypothetical protein